MSQHRVSRTGDLAQVRVLVVEDCGATRQLIADSLALHGYQVDTACDSTDCLAKFRRGGFDLVLTNHDILRLDGRKLAAAIKAESPRTPILMASSDPLAAYGNVPLAVDFFIRKPFTLVQLREAIKAIVWLHQPPVPSFYEPAGPR